MEIHYAIQGMNVVPRLLGVIMLNFTQLEQFY